DVHLTAPSPEVSGFVLDPTATDACLHGLFPLLKLQDENQNEQLFVPGHFGRVRVYRSESPVGARLVLIKGDRTGICINVSFFSADGSIIADMMSVWLRPMPTSQKTMPFLWNEKTITIESKSAALWEPTADLAQAGDYEPSNLEVVRNAIGARLAWNLAISGNEQGQFDRRLNEAEILLEAMDVARVGTGEELNSEDCPWPELAELLKLLIEIEPDAIDELEVTLHGQITDKVNDAPGFARMRGSVLDYLDQVPANDGRVLMVGHIDPTVLNAVCERASDIVIATDKTDAIDALRLRLDETQSVHITTLDDALKLPAFDIVIGCGLAQTIRPPIQRQLAKFVAEGNPAIFFDYSPEVFEVMTGRYSSGDAVQEFDGLFTDLGVEMERIVSRYDTSITYAYIGSHGEAYLEPQSVQVIGTSTLADRLRQAAAPPSEKEGIAIIALEVTEDLVSTVLRQSEKLRDLPAQTDTVWIVQEGLAGSDSLKGLRRVLRNELGRDIRVMSVASDVAPGKVIELAASSRELEVVLSADHTTSTRITPFPNGPSVILPHERLVLSQPPSGRTESLNWRIAPRVEPKDDEIEIEVAATALNFRDVMFARGLLPPDILNGGYAGATLGMECAGTVTRSGPNAHFRPGDRVIAFSPNAFATHVTISSRAATAAPSALELNAAATIPVIFVTAEYALTELARIRSNEWCLIHGAAGGVGLAAIQVAKRAGAKVIATAGSDKKRALLRLLGVDHICDSRSLEFVDDVDRITGGKGVDVILNSLAGKAMEQGLACLAPFGRFIELGKRDFVANTSIGLRAMRNNISYFGVDADQLLHHRPELSDRIMKNISEGFENGEYSVPPVRTYPSDQVVDAFRLMENSGHIGKVVVTPPDIGIKAQSTP
ncbi:MAG: zinc-binding dehydrogenase, partial [Boseongicola sp.]|nr:zinc-binding dehydrogenase [Boseongicola sp.]